MPASRKPDQSAPSLVSATGATNSSSPDLDPRAQSGEYLTTAQVLRLLDTDHSLKLGAHGPTLSEVFHLREKITPKDPGVAVSGDVARAFVSFLAAALGLHRAWGRAPRVMAATVPAAGT
jgi:hypothetical protein